MSLHRSVFQNIPFVVKRIFNLCQLSRRVVRLSSLLILFKSSSYLLFSVRVLSKLHTKTLRIWFFSICSSAMFWLGIFTSGALNAVKWSLVYPVFSMTYPFLYILNTLTLNHISSEFKTTFFFVLLAFLSFTFIFAGLFLLDIYFT